VHAQHGRNELRHKHRSMGQLRRIQRLLRHDGNTVEASDGFDMWNWDVQCVQLPNGDAVVYACGPQHELWGDELWGVERKPRHLLQCLRADRNADEDGDEQRIQLRYWAVRE